MADDKYLAKALAADKLQIDKLILLLPKAILALLMISTALKLRGMWIDIVVLVFKQAQTLYYVDGVLGLLGTAGLVLIVLKEDLNKWVKAFGYTTLICCLLQTCVNGITGLITGGAWVIVEFNKADWIALTMVLINRSIRKAVESK